MSKEDHADIYRDMYTRLNNRIAKLQAGEPGRSISGSFNTVDGTPEQIFMDAMLQFIWSATSYFRRMHIPENRLQIQCPDYILRLWKICDPYLRGDNIKAHGVPIVYSDSQALKVHCTDLLQAQAMNLPVFCLSFETDHVPDDPYGKVLIDVANSYGWKR